MSILSAIVVQSRTLFSSPAQGNVPAVLCNLVATTITIAELIQQTVAKQIVELQQKQCMNVTEALRVIEQHYLPAEAMTMRAKPETIGDVSASRARQDAIATAVEQAWDAFEQRAYIIVIDGKIAQSLEEEITCGHNREVTFLRLIPLVGG